MAKSTQVAKTEEAQVPSTEQQMPDFMKGMQGQGTENLGMKDIETPRLKLLQLTSKELIEREDCKAGQWFHTVLEQPLPKEIEVVVLFVDIRYLLWRPLDDNGGGILARADDAVHWSPPNGVFKVKINKNTKEVVWKTAKTVAESRLAEWGTYDPDDSNSQPAATLMYNIVMAFPQYPDMGPAVVTFQRTGVPVAKKLGGKLKLAKAPSYGIKFVMSSQADTNGADQTYFVPKMTMAGFVTDQNQFNEYKELYELFKKMGVNIKDLEDAQEDAPVAPGGDTAEDGDKAQY